MMNPFTFFMQLKPSVKITVIVCATLSFLAFMYFATEAGVFGEWVMKRLG